MYFKDFPMFLYDFNYGNKVKTAVVKDITRNVRVRKEILSNISLYDEYDIIDGETPELIAEKFYGSPEYHWVIMIANERYDWTSDFPLKEEILQRHIKTTYNPTLYSSDWFWDTHDDGLVYIHIKITSDEVPFEVAYLTAPVKITLSDLATGQFVKVINFPTDPIGLDEKTQYFYFPYNEPWDITEFGKEGATRASGVGAVQIKIQTEGRENNPVKFVNSKGMAVNPETPGAIPVTGATVHRSSNDGNRRIKIISPSLLETLIKNYEEYLK
jgi:hypothetical protein